MKLFYIAIHIQNKEIISIDINSRGGYIDTLAMNHNTFGNTCIVYGVLEINNAKEALDVGFKHIEENKLI